MSGLPLKIEPDLATMRRRLTDRFAALRTKLRWQISLDAFARATVVVVAILLASLVLDWRLQLSLSARVVILLLSFLAAAFLIWRYLFKPLQHSLDPIDLAAALDSAVSNNAGNAIAPRVASVFQLPNLVELPSAPSSEMIDRAVKNNYAALEDIDLSNRLNRRHRYMSLLALCSAIALPLLLAFLMPHAARLWADRWLFGSAELWPRDTIIEVIGLNEGRLIVPRGEPSTLRVVVTDGQRPTETVWLRLKRADGSKETVTLSQFEKGDFRYDLTPISHTVSAELWGGDGQIGPFAIDPLDRPRITGLTLHYKHPRDSAEKTHDFTGKEGNLHLLHGTDVKLQLTANVPVTEVRVSSESSTPPPFEQVSEQSFVAAWKHNAAVRMRVELVSAEANLVSFPQLISVGIKPDRPPRVSLSHTGVRRRVTAVATIPLKVVARDDLGISAVVLSTQVERNSKAVEETKTEDTESSKPADATTAILFGPSNPATETRVEVVARTELKPMKLNPGDLIRISGKADDDCYTGIQTSHSRTIAYRIVTAEELFREILLRQQQLRARLRKATTGAETLRESLAIADLPADADALLSQHRLIQREVWQVTHSLEDSVTEMQLNQLGGAEAHQLLTQKVVTPLARLHDEQLSQQRQALESLSKNSQAEFVNDAIQRQQSIVQQLNTILKNMAQWDSFIDVVNQLNAIIKLEERVRSKTEELQEKEFESIFNE